MGRGGHVQALLRRAAIVAALAALALVAVGTAGARGSAEAPCWKHLTLDWADNGVVDKTYPIPCYSQAIAHLNTTDFVYTSAEDDIRRAQQRAIAAAHGGGGPVTTAPDKSTSSDGTSVPVPLLVLGGIALLLVAIGGVGLFRRRGRDTA